VLTNSRETVTHLARGRAGRGYAVYWIRYIGFCVLDCGWRDAQQPTFRIQERSSAVQNTNCSILPAARSFQLLDPQADPDRSIPHGRCSILAGHSPIGLRPALDPQVEVLPCLVEILPLFTLLTYRIR
jgi:hypothetical protein